MRKYIPSAHVFKPADNSSDAAVRTLWLRCQGSKAQVRPFLLSVSKFKILASTNVINVTPLVFLEIVVLWPSCNSMKLFLELPILQPQMEQTLQV